VVEGYEAPSIRGPIHDDHDLRARYALNLACLPERGVGLGWPVRVISGGACLPYHPSGGLTTRFLPGLPVTFRPYG
jgi:hypothetical protein